VPPVRVASSRSPTASQRSDDGAAVEVMLLRLSSSATSEFISDVVTLCWPTRSSANSPTGTQHNATIGALMSHN
jgi:hypothetical protein